MFGANLSNSVIINPQDYFSLRPDKNNTFDNAIIDDQAFINYITKSKRVPNIKKLNNKRELQTELEGKKIDESRSVQLLSASVLSEQKDDITTSNS